MTIRIAFARSLGTALERHERRLTDDDTDGEKQCGPLKGGTSFFVFGAVV
ncbi:hypothetical protein [Neoroseomonas soli]|uniref:Uncharacterized protein n=1 Tax=Neoroseomonas soli TaxID=1081025 RepID=A0A9X9WTI9_9PROT|nr:hypothetical protein [Neoroseomonas soli]MBR0670468.1 hypothetical protein [Neoroseomonas soli]